MSVEKISTLSKLTRTYRLINAEAERKKRSVFSIIQEMIHLYYKIGIGPNYYLQAGMADSTMTWDYKCDHISDADYHKSLDKLNPRAYRKITQHKLAEKSFLQFANIPCAAFIGFYEPIKGFDAKGSVLTNEQQLSTLLASYNGQAICIKIPEGYGGEGFFAGKVFVEHDEVLLQAFNEDKAHTLTEVLSRYGQTIAREGLLFEEYINQHEGFSVFNPSSVNTLRVWVLQQDNAIKVIGTYIRVGRDGKLTDNGGGGGIMCPVDVNTGVVDKGLTTSIPFREEFEQHPDHQAQFYRAQLPCWPEIIACAQDTLKKLPYTRFAGLDIALSTEGPIIVEVNVCPDKNGAANGKIRSRALKTAADKLQ